MRLNFDRRTKDEIKHQCGFDENEELGRVYELLWRRRSIVEIAEALSVSESTVSRRIKDIKAIMEAQRRPEA